jgi:uncharacterized protein
MGEHVNRRKFMGATGVAMTLGATAGHAAPATGTSLQEELRRLVDTTPFVDTHEHLWPEALRIKGKTEETEVPPPDFGILFNHYTDSDLHVSGMPQADYDKVRSWKVSPKEKWKLLAPYYARCRHTGYQRCLRESVQALYGEDDVREENFEAIGEKLRDDIQPGFYRRIVREVANIECAHVNSVEGPVFRDTEPDPELFPQDLWTIGMGSGLRMDTLKHCAEGDVTNLAECHAAIEAAFAKHGPKAVAVKDQGAYWRSLNYEDVSAADTTPLFARFAKDEKSLDEAEKKALSDHLFRHCVRQATEHKLPVKLHTGYFAGHSGMELRRVRDNLSDLCPLMRDFPETKFVLMHMAYPYQEELIALAKHYSQVYADMCWAWIINPAASVRFLKEFIMAAPACKVLCFGGDYLPVELVPGHARVARQGIVQTLAELIEEGWLSESDVPELVERLMRGNANEVFDHNRALSNWG